MESLPEKIKPRGERMFKKTKKDKAEAVENQEKVDEEKESV